MRKNSSRTGNPEDESAILAEKIKGKFASRTAIITASGVVLAALVGGLWAWMSKTPPIIEKKRIAGKVIDKATRQKIRGATVSLESIDRPLDATTDSEGGFSFLLSDPSKEVRIRVKAVGYEDYDRQIIPAQNNDFIEIGIEPSRNMPAPSPPSPTASPPPSKVPQHGGGKEDASKYLLRCRSLYGQRKFEEAIVQCDRALKIQPSNREAMDLRKVLEAIITSMSDKKR